MRLLTLGFLLLVTPLAQADVLTLVSTRDNTLWDDAAGALSSGVGPNLFAGTNGTGQARRGIVAFDVAGTIPAGSTITSVSLMLNCSQTPGGGVPNPVGLHRLLADWGEGTSSSSGGGGAPSTPGDATWIHTFFNTGLWASPGGDFVASASDTQPVSTTGLVTWTSPQLAADVQSMLDDPANDFGWLLRADESLVGVARRFDTRELASASLRPQLSIVYTPAAGVPVPGVVLALTAALLAAGGATVLRRR